MQYDPEEILNTMYSIVLFAKQNKDIQNMSRAELDNWITEQLKACGIYIVPVGSQWALEWRDNAL